MRFDIARCICVTGQRFPVTHCTFNVVQVRVNFKDGGMFNNKRTVTGSLHKNGSDVPGGKCALLSVSKFVL